MNKQNLYKSIENFRNAVCIANSNYPLNIFDLCRCHLRNVAIESVPFKTPDLRGMACISSNMQLENHAILVNSNKPENEQNYHAAHELVHILLHNDVIGHSFRCFDSAKPQQNSYIEWQANEGAAELLVPYKILLPLIRDNYAKMCEGFGTYFFCEECSKRFGVSRVVIKNRLNSLRYEIDQYINGVNLDNIKILSNLQQRSQGIYVQSLTAKEDFRLLKNLERWIERTRAV